MVRHGCGRKGGRGIFSRRLKSLLCLALCVNMFVLVYSTPVSKPPDNTLENGDSGLDSSVPHRMGRAPTDPELKAELKEIDEVVSDASTADEILQNTNEVAETIAKAKGANKWLAVLKLSNFLGKFTGFFGTLLAPGAACAKEWTASKAEGGTFSEKLIDCIVGACKETDELVIGVAAGATGAKVGGLTGGAVGAALGGVGAAPGALIGSIIGGVGAGYAASEAYDNTTADRKYDEEVCEQNARESAEKHMKKLVTILRKDLIKNVVMKMKAGATPWGTEDPSLVGERRCKKTVSFVSTCDNNGECQDDPEAPERCEGEFGCMCDTDGVNSCICVPISHLSQNEAEVDKAIESEGEVEKGPGRGPPRGRGPPGRGPPGSSPSPEDSPTTTTPQRFR